MSVVAQISDMHLDHRLSKSMGIDTRRNFEKILEDIEKRNADEIIVTGDMAEESAVEWFFRKMDGLKKRWSYIFGNHDNRALFNSGGNGALHFYSRGIDGYAAVFLDSGDGIIDDSQAGWMEREMDKASGAVLLFIHHPIINCGTLFMDFKYPLKNRETILDLLKGKKKDIIIFCGHYHMEDERETGTIRQYAAPSVYYQIKRDSEELKIDDIPIGYRLITIGNEISSEIIRIPAAPC